MKYNRAFLEEAIAGELDKYVVFPTEGTRARVIQFCADTWTNPERQHADVLWITGCHGTGKTRLLEIMERVCNQANSVLYDALEGDGRGTGIPYQVRVDDGSHVILMTDGLDLSNVPMVLPWKRQDDDTGDESDDNELPF